MPMCAFLNYKKNVHHCAGIAFRMRRTQPAGDCSLSAHARRDGLQLCKCEPRKLRRLMCKAIRSERGAESVFVSDGYAYKKTSGGQGWWHKTSRREPASSSAHSLRIHYWPVPLDLPGNGCSCTCCLAAAKLCARCDGINHTRESNARTANGYRALAAKIFIEIRYAAQHHLIPTPRREHMFGESTFFVHCSLFSLLVCVGGCVCLCTKLTLILRACYFSALARERVHISQAGVRANIVSLPPHRTSYT